ncbi:MAG: 3-hydroxyacyl-ACP dehydratase FabZ [Verrucomicrobia bacterium]|nr:3-hydroxyacyl-ACP dehydratase FabZ [Verrucomicrobiota bacterium]MCG2679991.1 3-hydroxyacyl-ACP dehydratase FabZ [Kiritimatiellia bacterium]MBU4247376.1 3-hydroxyacyl-ACP dehydratase FabZ [Verrucomicrobiota bacterium]MBU4290625.1 3-hydroxyacyl-ACP dehydratase FabZ [Verrucomicrobiota bacterium]MBU4429214.1 3-hydroxyacyl-ACP dehydratase FabZ [Verrucomicrobiota bacterium]
MPAIDIQEIMKIVPHRYPMLMVDRILECDDDKKIVGMKNLTFNEPFFQGHFPGRPIMPGVLQLEAMAQVGGVLLSRRTGLKGLIPLFMAVDKARFRRMIIPGDQMRIELEVTNARARVLRLQGKVLVEGQVAAEAELLFMVTDEKAE